MPQRNQLQPGCLPAALPRVTLGLSEDRRTQFPWRYRMMRGGSEMSLERAVLLTAILIVAAFLLAPSVNATVSCCLPTAACEHTATADDFTLDTYGFNG